MPATTYLANKLLDHSLGTAEYTFPSTVYVSLHIADPGDLGGDEIEGYGYVRQAASFGAAAEKISESDMDLVYEDMPECISSPVTHLAIWDQGTGGNCLYYGSLSVQKVVNLHDTFTLNSGEVEVAIDFVEPQPEPA